MPTSLERYNQRRLVSSYFSVVLSIFLVMFLLGLLGILIFNANRLANHFKEQIPITVYFKNASTEKEVKAVQSFLDTVAYVKSARYISKDEAAQIYKSELGEDFVAFLGYNPLQNSIDLHLNAAYVAPDTLAQIQERILAFKGVSEMSYDAPLVTLLTENVKKIGYWLLGLSGLFFFIAVLLINSSLRLSIYAKRFIIKTMQMVGATKSFIRRPFVWQSVKLGLVGSFLAVLVLGAGLYYAHGRYPELKLIDDTVFLSLLCTGVLVGGCLITWLSTFFATQRFLNLRTDDLYY